MKILVYFDNIVKYIELKKELAVWDDLSDEALQNFERTLLSEDSSLSTEQDGIV